MPLPRPNCSSSGPSRQLILDSMLGTSDTSKSGSMLSVGSDPELSDDDLSVVSSSPAAPPPAPSKKRKTDGRGRPADPMWEHFDRLNQKAVCKYCKVEVPPRPANAMMPHLVSCTRARLDGVDLAKSCPKIRNSKEFRLIKKEQAGLLFSQRKAKDALFDMLMSTCIPFSVLDDEHFIALLKSLNPLFKPFSRYTLSTSLIPQRWQEVKMEIDEKIEKLTFVTLSIDGWTTRSNEGLYGITVVDPDGTEYIYDSIELGSSSATADNLLSSLKPVFSKMAEKKIVALVTDGAANMKKLRNLVEFAVKGCVGIYCFVHALNLFCLALFKAREIDLIFADACRVIECINKSSKLTEQLKKNNLSLGISVPKLVSVGKTRFSTCYAALETLLKNKDGLLLLLATPDFVLPKEVKEIVLKNLFWVKVNALVYILTPLSEILKLSQKPYFRLSEACYHCIALVFYTITRAGSKHNEIGSTTLKHISCCAVKLLYAHLEDDIYYLAAVLDPQFKFIPSRELISRLESRLRQYVFGFGASSELAKAVEKDFYRFLKEKSKIVEQEPLIYWRNVVGYSNLAIFAIGIFSITTNSMSCERAFSTMGWINAQRRSRLSKSRLFASAMVHRHVTNNRPKTVMRPEVRDEFTNAAVGGFESFWNVDYNQKMNEDVKEMLSAKTGEVDQLVRYLSTHFDGDTGLAVFLNSGVKSRDSLETTGSIQFSAEARELFGLPAN